MKNRSVRLFVTSLLILNVVAPPPPIDRNKRNNIDDNTNNNDDLDRLEYSRYLKEVVEILEDDPAFRKKLEHASNEDFRSGNIAEHLSLVQHHVRTRLDEAKQREMMRLRELVSRRMNQLSERKRLALSRSGYRGMPNPVFLPQHIGRPDSVKFSEKDLEYLIRKATVDLDELDRRREQEFKEYELRKEYERRTKLAKLPTADRERLERLHDKLVEQKKNHRKVNHPGSRKQMEEVWEQVDHLEAQQFTPRSFFKLHDVNDDGFIDETELEAIMMKEAEKIHDETPEGDPIEKQEEIDRMSQHVLKEFDKNNDRMLSLDEFEFGVKGDGARNDQGWQSIEDKPVFSDQEFQNFSAQMSPMSTPKPAHQTPATQPQVNQTQSH